MWSQIINAIHSRGNLQKWNNKTILLSSHTKIKTTKAYLLIKSNEVEEKPPLNLVEHTEDESTGAS